MSRTRTSPRAGTVHATHPARTCAADIDVGEWTAASRVGVKPGTANELRIARFDALDGVEDHLHVRKVHFMVAVQIRHLAVALLVNEHVSGVPELVTAVSSAAFAANGKVVGGGPEA